MQTKRLIVIGVSLLVGALVTWGIVYAYLPLHQLLPFLPIPITIGFGTTFESFAYSNVVLLFIAVAGIVGIWLDYFLQTQFLKS
jgi:hypothetical protein